MSKSPLLSDIIASVKQWTIEELLEELLENYPETIHKFIRENLETLLKMMIPTN